MLCKHKVIGSSPVVSKNTNKIMRSRISQHKNILVNYDFLTQFPIKTFNHIPVFSSCELQIRNIHASDLKQICLNLVSIQFAGNIASKCVPNSVVCDLKAKITGTNIYFIFESLILLAYKNRLQHSSKAYINTPKNTIVIHGKEFLSILEHFSHNSNLLKSLEKTANKHLKISILCQVKHNSIFVNSYFLRSLGYPL